MKRLESHLSLFASSLLAGLLAASLATGSAQSAVASLVQIVNTSANPVPTQDMDNRARQPVSFMTFVMVSPNAQNGYASQAYRVPTGKRLVVEYVSVNGGVQNPEQVLSVSLAEEGTSSSVYVPVSDPPAFVNSPGFHAALASQAVVMYASAGDYIDVGVQTDGGANGASMYVVWTGYLVNLP